MKKNVFMMIGLFMAYMSFGQQTEFYNPEDSGGVDPNVEGKPSTHANAFSINSETCDNIPICNRVLNGDFSDNTCSFTDLWSYYSWYDDNYAFQENSVTNWSRFSGSPDIFNSNNPMAHMWCRESGGVLLAESIKSCTELLSGGIYILSLDYQRIYMNDPDKNDAVAANLIVDIADNSVDGFYTISDNYPIITVPIQNIFNSGGFVGDNLTHANSLFTNTAATTMNRIIIHSETQSTLTERFGVDNIEIIPVSYDDVFTCATTVTLEPNCPDVTTLLGGMGLTFTWTSTPSGAIVAGTQNSLIPTVTTTANPTCTLTINDNGTLHTTIVNITNTPVTMNILNAATVTNVPCGQTTGGAIDINPALLTGTAPYTYLWNGSGVSNVTTEDISNLAVGTYLLEVTDANGCTDVLKIEVGTSELIIDESHTDTWTGQSCGSVTASVNPSSIGSGSYTWVWLNSSGAVVGTTETVVDLAPGIYSYTVSDPAFNCTETGSITIGEVITPPSADYTEYLCTPGSTNLSLTYTPSSISSYNWSTGATSSSITVNQPGDYTVNAYSSGGCRLQSTFHIMPHEVHFDVDFKDCGYVGSPAWDTPHTYFITSDVPMSSYSVTINDYHDGGYLGTVPPNFAGGMLVHQVPYIYSNGYSIVNITGNHPTTGCPVNETITLYQFQHIGPTDPLPPLTGVWDNRHFIFKRDVVISSGTLVIKNSEIEFEPGYGIIVSGAGTKLIVDNSELRPFNCSESIWKGIMVEGNSGAPHNPGAQPSVNVVNNALITGAYSGIHSVNGGIVYTDQNARFVNNNYGIQIENCYADNNSNYSEIKKTYFETNDEGLYLSGFSPQKFVYLKEFSSLKISFCSFENTDYTYPTHLRGKGIESIGVKKLDIIEKNYFNRLTTAAMITNSEYLNLINNSFRNNHIGVFSNRNNILTATLNSFNNHLLMPESNSLQMLVTGSTSPDIYKNSFDNGVTGLYLSKANYGTFQIYKNTFKGFDMYSNNLNGHPTALLTNGVHGSISSNTGAEVKCNTFTDYDYAIAVMGGEIKRDHGYASPSNTQAPAANVFTDDDNMIDGRFFVNQGATNGKYFYYQHANPSAQLETYFTPFVSTAYPYVIPVGGNSSVYSAASCPDIPMAPPSVQSIKDEVNQLNSKIEIKERELEDRIDLGNTNYLLSLINSTTDDNYDNLVSTISKAGSYLSNEVAIEFINKSTDRPLAKAIALMAVSPLTEEAQELINNLDMPDVIKQNIKAFQSGISLQEKDRREIQQLEAQRYMLLSKAVKSTYKSNSTEEVIALLLEQDELQYKEMAYHLLISSGKFNEAASLMSEMKESISMLSEDEQYLMDDYMKLLMIERSMINQSDAERKQLILSNLSLLERIMNTPESKGAVMAEIYLVEAGVVEDKLFVQLPNPQNGSSQVEDVQPSDVKDLSSLNDIIGIYPNPVEDMLIVEYAIFNGLNSGQLNIFDINGKLLISHKISKSMDIVKIDVSELSSGTYIMSIDSNADSSKSKKFVVK